MRATASTATSSTTVRFVDSGVLLYAISRAREEQDNAARANDILAARDVAVSVQVLQEFYVQATRASRPDPLTHEQAARLVESFLRFPVLDITTELFWPRQPASASASGTGMPRSWSGERSGGVGAVGVTGSEPVTSSL